MKRQFPSGSEAPRLYSEAQADRIARKRRWLDQIERLEAQGRQDDAEVLRCTLTENGLTK